MKIAQSRYEIEREEHLKDFAELIAETANKELDRIAPRVPNTTHTINSHALFGSIIVAAGRCTPYQAQKYLGWITRSNFTAWMAGGMQSQPEERQRKPREVSRVVDGLEVCPMWVLIAIALKEKSEICLALQGAIIEALRTTAPPAAPATGNESGGAE